MLQRTLSTVLPFVAARTTIPVMSHVRIGQTAKETWLTATNMEQVIEAVFQNQVEQDTWSGCVPAKTLAEIVGNMGNVDMQWNDKTAALTIKSAGSKSTLKGIDANEFPAVPRGQEEFAITLSEESAEAIAKTVAPFASNDEARPVLGAIAFVFGDGKLVVQAADGFRLASLTLEKDYQHTGTYLFPAQAFRKAVKAMGGGAVTIGFSKNIAAMSNHDDSVNVWTRLVDGSYPDISVIVNNAYSTNASHLVVEADALAQALRHAKIFAVQAANLVKVTIDEDVVTISADSAETGSGTVSVQMVSFTGEAQLPMTFGMNVAYMLEAVGAIDGRVAISFSQPNIPVGIYRPANNNWLSVIMPMRLG